MTPDDPRAALVAACDRVYQYAREGRLVAVSNGLDNIRRDAETIADERDDWKRVADDLRLKVGEAAEDAAHHALSAPAPVAEGGETVVQVHHLYNKHEPCAFCYQPADEGSCPVLLQHGGSPHKGVSKVLAERDNAYNEIRRLLAPPPPNPDRADAEKFRALKAKVGHLYDFDAMGSTAPFTGTPPNPEPSNG